MTTVYLHIGTMKTGTSALQKFLADNREVLGQKGYYYPNLSVKLKLPRSVVYRNANFLVRQSQEEDADKKIEEMQRWHTKAYATMEKLAKEYDNLILSDELIWHRGNYISKTFWQNLVEDMKKINCELKIVVYLRRQDQVIESLWNQLVKANSLVTKTFEECIQTNAFRFFPLNYYKQLEKIARYVGKENILVRPYERGQFAGEDHSIYTDFLQTIGLEKTEEFIDPEIKANPGLSGNYIEIKRLINMVPQYRAAADRDFMRHQIMDASVHQDSMTHMPKTSMFSKEEQAAFIQKYEEQNRLVATQYLGREDGVLFYDAVKELPKWTFDESTMNRDLLVAFTEVICEQQLKIEELAQQLDDMKAEVTAMHKSAIFRGYRKVRSVVKGEKE